MRIICRKIFKSPDTCVPVEIDQDNAVPSHFSSHVVHKCPFYNLISALFFWCFLFVILLFPRVHKYDVEVLSSIPEYKKAVMSVMEKICVLDNKSHSGIS